MASKKDLDKLFIDVAARVSEMSVSRRAKVGAVIVRDGNIVSMGWNGTPKGFDNNCEVDMPDGSLLTKTSVVHAEANAILKLASSGGGGDKSTVYTLFSPCVECAKMIISIGAERVVYRHKYRVFEGLDLLAEAGVLVEHIDE